jgi:hypothetical protein
MLTHKQQEAAYMATLSGQELADYQHHTTHRRAASVAARCAERHFTRYKKLKIEQPDAGVWPALHNGFYQSLAAANKQSEFGTPMLNGVATDHLSRPGITATTVLAALYSVTASQLWHEKQNYGRADNIAEFQKLLDILGPIVAELKPGKEANEYTEKMTADYKASKGKE